MTVVTFRGRILFTINCELVIREMLSFRRTLRISVDVRDVSRIEGGTFDLAHLGINVLIFAGS